MSPRNRPLLLSAALVLASCHEAGSTAPDAGGGAVCEVGGGSLAEERHATPGWQEGPLRLPQAGVAPASFERVQTVQVELSAVPGP